MLVGKDASASPVACTLSPDEFRRRRDELLPVLLQRAGQVMDLENGLRFHFAAAPGLLGELASIIEQEQVCCSFLRFQISIEPGAGAIALEVTGPAGTREMLRNLGM
jgi:hypothetical protein